VVGFDADGRSVHGFGDTANNERDVALVRRVLACDATAIDELATRMRCIGRILAARNRRANGLLRQEDVEDLCQDVAAVVWSQLASYRGIGPLEAWTHGYCDNAFRNAARRRYRELRSAQGAVDAASLPEPWVDSDGMEDSLRRCMSRLSDEQQRILHRKHHDGATLGEIAAENEVNLNTVKSQYVRALHDLRCCLGGEPQP
jgi:RNA polymerase sigma factor (sigma-70 family)